jgi:hypothetical protein
MTSEKEDGSRLKASVLPLLPEDWISRPGRWFRQVGTAITRFNRMHGHVEDKLNQTPDVFWKTAQIKSSQAELNLAQAEEKKLSAELARRTMLAKARQEEAAADIAESKARMSLTEELQGILKFAKDLREANCIPYWDAEGNISILPAPANYDWDGLTKALVGSETPAVTGFTFQQTK